MSQDVKFLVPLGHAMKCAAFISLVAILSSAILLTTRYLLASEPARIYLTQWTPPDIAVTAYDPFGELVRYGYALLTDTANEIGPTVAEPTHVPGMPSMGPGRPWAQTRQRDCL